MNKDEALEHLRSDPLRHIVSLKMLAQYGQHMKLEFRQIGDEWALLSLLPTHVSEYDSMTYPAARFVALIDGNSEQVKLDMLEGLPRTEIVLKTYDEQVKKYAISRLRADSVAAFVSFTSTGDMTACPASDTTASGKLTSAAVAAFGQNCYGFDELSRYFREGAKWFGIYSDVNLASACFVFRNFENVWEIAGVFTDPGKRRQGLGARVVSAALAYLLTRNLLPRYQVIATNTPSIRLAEKIGLREFIRIEHLHIRRTAT